MNIYIGNLSFNTTEEELRQAFEEFGEVTSVNIITDRDSGRPRGFAFVEMASKDDGMAAISGLNGRESDGREWNVNEARPREPRSGGGGGRGGNRGGGRNRGW
jgi:RNA recognition motif-containing protein